MQYIHYLGLKYAKFQGIEVSFGNKSEQKIRGLNSENPQKPHNWVEGINKPVIRKLNGLKN